MDKNFKIGVNGSGTMGNGIAHIAAQSGFKTILVDINKTQLDKAILTINHNLDRQIKKKQISLSDKGTIINNILPTTNIHDCKNMDLVIEAISEKYDLKASIFKQLDTICKKTTILASNTVTFNTGVFDGGDVVTIINNTNGNITITQGSGAAMYWTADGTTGNRTLGPRGVATIVMSGSSAFYISGSGLS